MSTLLFSLGSEWSLGLSYASSVRQSEGRSELVLAWRSPLTLLHSFVARSLMSLLCLNVWLPRPGEV